MKNFKEIAKFFIVGVKDFKFDPELVSFLKEYPVRGLALFNSPYDNPLNIWNDKSNAIGTVYEFMAKVAEKVSFVAADQEGGRVRRLRSPFINLPSAQKMAETVDLNLRQKETIYRLAAEQMALTGIHFNFAPVCDIRYPESHSVIGDRSYGSSLKEILPLVEIFCRSFESVGVKTSLKHLPGHGATEFDSHEKIATLFKSKKQIFAEDFQIFEKAQHFASAVMTAHIAYQEKPETLISLDPTSVGELKQKLKREDLFWVTDDLAMMKAVEDRDAWVDAFRCQYDFILFCGSLEKAAQAIDQTIRYAEENTRSFSEEQLLEKRLNRSSGFLANSRIRLDSFDIWKENILKREEEALEILQSSEFLKS